MINIYDTKIYFDRLVSLVGLLFLWPVLLVVAILIKVKMPGGPVLFVQKRVGKGGELFDCHKFRTMRVNDKVDGSKFKVQGGLKKLIIRKADGRLLVLREIIGLRPLARNYVTISWTSYLVYGMYCAER